MGSPGEAEVQFAAARRRGSDQPPPLAGAEAGAVLPGAAPGGGRLPGQHQDLMAAGFPGGPGCSAWGDSLTTRP
eukprot:616107-Prorocentrum_minimum.AAC.1